MKKLLRFIPALIIMAVIFFFSAQDADSSSQLSDSIVSVTAGEENVGIRFFTVIVRKGAHFLEYAALGAALCFGFLGVFSEKRLRVFVISSLSGIAYAVTDEIHQYFVPGRACMAADVLLDGFGAVAGVLAVMLCIKVFRGLGKKQ